MPNDNLQNRDLTEYFATVLRGPEGIWQTAGTPPVSYAVGGHDRCFSVEDTSFWFQHRNACISALLRAHPPADGGPIFDVGGGNGYVAKGITEAGYAAVLVEPGPEGAHNARLRGVENVVCATLEAAGLKPGTLPAVGIFDVLEHVEGDAQFLRQLHQALVPGGRLYLTVPAHQLLWSNEDVIAGHHRRYPLAGLEQVLTQAGFKLDYASYFFRPLVLPILLLRTLPSRLGLAKSTPDAAKVAKDHGSRQGLAMRMLQRAHVAEVDNIRGGKRMGFGASCIAAATRAG